MPDARALGSVHRAKRERKDARCRKDPLGRNLFKRKLRNVRSLLRVFDGDRRDIPLLVDVEQSVFIQVTGICDFRLSEFDVKRTRQKANSKQ